MIGDLPLDLPIVVLLGSVGGDLRARRGRDGGGDRLRLRAGHGEHGGDHDEGGDGPGDPGAGAAGSALGSLLRHEPLVPYTDAHGHPGWLSWISYNRVWLVPYASAVFVVLVEVLVGIFGSRDLPPAAHGALGWFALWAVGRGSKNQERHQKREEEIRTLARKLGIPAQDVADEFAEFKLRRRGRDA